MGGVIIFAMFSPIIQRIKWFIAPAVLALMLVFATDSKSQVVIETDIVKKVSAAYWYDASNMTYVSGGVGEAFGGFGELFCFHSQADDPPTSSRTYEVVTAAELFKESGGSTVGMYVLGWMFDNYYDSIFGGSGSGLSESNTFQRALWEIAMDFNGDVASIDLYSGTYWPEFTNTIIDDIITNFDTISSGYTLSNFNFEFLKDSESGYQDMLLVTPVPEPSAALSIGLVATFALLRRRRMA